MGNRLSYGLVEERVDQVHRDRLVGGCTGRLHWELGEKTITSVQPVEHVKNLSFVSECVVGQGSNGIHYESKERIYWKSMKHQSEGKLWRDVKWEVDREVDEPVVLVNKQVKIA